MDPIEHIKNFISNHNILVLGTSSNDQPHTCTVFYVTADAKTLYFKSSNDSIHANNLLVNNKVACALYDKESSPFGEKQGVQILGVAERINTKEEANSAVELYIGTFNSPKDKFYPLEQLLGDKAKSSMYKITVQQAKMLDSVNHITPERYLDIS